MVTITDVSPTRSNTPSGPKWRDVTGRMLSLASSDDGKLVFAGSFSSGLWVSEDGGESWVQLAWEQPAPDQFGVPGALGGMLHPVAGGWAGVRALVRRPESAVPRRHHRRWTAPTSSGSVIPACGPRLSNGDGTSTLPRRAGRLRSRPAAGAWTDTRVSSPNHAAKGRADIVGFGEHGVWTWR